MSETFVDTPRPPTGLSLGSLNILAPASLLEERVAKLLFDTLEGSGYGRCWRHTLKRRQFRQAARAVIAEVQKAAQR